ncbi:MAG TPA: toprim domain-containing protein [Thermoplasmataceae archaeon]|nr:toprim domain-containing protein [Thermoplasmataceae archaeon]
MALAEPRVFSILEQYRMKNESVPIVVEGRNDISCLRSIDFTGKIVHVNSGSSILNFSENLAEEYSEIIILTDFDRKGKTLKKKIQNYLVSSGVKADTYLWEYLCKRSPIATVEELPSEVERIKRNFGYYGAPGTRDVQSSKS